MFLFPLKKIIYCLQSASYHYSVSLYRKKRMDVTESHVTMQRSVLVMALSMPVHASSATRGSTVKVREAISNRLRFIDSDL